MQKNELQIIIGQNLYRIRSSQNITRDKLAEQVGLSTTYYANLEYGNKMMSVPVLRKLADCLGVSVDSLLYENKPENKLGNIQSLLRDQPDQVLAYVEEVVRASITFAQQASGNKTEKEEPAHDEQGV